MSSSLIPPQAPRGLFFLDIPEKVNCVEFSSDGTSLVSGSDDNTVKLWDIQTGGVVRTFYGHTGRVWCVSISADCIKIVSGSQ
jgi:WD40 repeat protein